jgi:hypothetical protein
MGDFKNLKSVGIPYFGPYPSFKSDNLKIVLVRMSL